MLRLVVAIIAILAVVSAATLTVAQEATPDAEAMPCPEAAGTPTAEPGASPMVSPTGSPTASPTASPVEGTVTPVVSPKAGEECTVEIQDNRFVPETIEIAVGTTVTWVNVGGAHTVHADDGSFNSNGTPLGTGDTFAHTFTAPGTFTYQCLVHFPEMPGTVIVK